MEDASSSSSGNGKLDESAALALIGRIMVGLVIFLSLIVAFIIILRLWSGRRRQGTGGDTRQQRREVKTKGLEPSILNTIPIIAFDAKEFKDGTLECTICLCEVSEGEKTRLLPTCNHGFHAECIDLWFQCHSTCPLCRNPILTTSESTGEETDQAATSASPSEFPISFPTNVMFWGNETQVSTLCPSTSNRPHGTLAIDIPGQINGEEEEKSGVPARFRRLMRLLSGSSRNVDVEQGGISPSRA